MTSERSFSPAATQTRQARMMLATVRCSASLIGATAVMPGSSPDATMIQPIAPCRPPRRADSEERQRQPAR